MLYLVQLSAEILPYHLFRLDDTTNKNDLQAIFLKYLIIFVHYLQGAEN